MTIKEKINHIKAKHPKYIVFCANDGEYYAYGDDAVKVHCICGIEIGTGQEPMVVFPCNLLGAKLDGSRKGILAMLVEAGERVAVIGDITNNK